MNINGLEILAIKNLKDMPFFKLKTIILQLGACFKQNVLYFILLFLFAALFLRKKIKLDSLGCKWLSLSLAFGIGQIVGAWKSGGNIGNYEVGMIPFLPFTVIAASYCYEQCIVTDKRQAILNFFACVVLYNCITLSAWSIKTIPQIVNKNSNDNSVSAYISKNYNGEKILYHANQYMQIARSTLEPGMEFATIPFYIKSHRRDLENALKHKQYKVVYIGIEYLKSLDAFSKIYFEEEIKSCEALQENYIEIQDPDMPESLKGQLFIAKD